MLIWRNTVLSKNVKYALTDTSNFFFVLSPELQEWLVKEISVPQVKQAFVMPAEFIAGLGMEQFVEENNRVIQNRYFESLEKAQEWLLS